MDKLGYFRIKRPDIVHETIDGETVIVNLENGVYYSLQNAGVDVWNMIETGANLQELTDLMAQQFDGTREEIEQALNDLLIVLQKEGLVEPASAKQTVSKKPQTVTKGEKVKFTPPILEKFSDLQELLLLDPIHEVDDEAGWPHKPEDGSEE
jgi:hypothetical protein